MSAEQHEQDMLEELDRMHEECASLQDDAQVKVACLPSNNSMKRQGQACLTAGKISCLSSLQQHYEQAVRDCWQEVHPLG